MVDIALQLCDILTHTHALPVIHRDLKLANTMVSPTDRITMLDFGVAATFKGATRTRQRLTRNRQVLGTVGYLAPEQVVQSGLIVPQTDLYAIGCILYELLTGGAPFTDALNVLLHQPPVPLSMLRPEIHPVLEAVITETLAKRQDKRPLRTGRPRPLTSPSSPARSPLPPPLSRYPPPAPAPCRYRFPSASVTPRPSSTRATSVKPCPPTRPSRRNSAALAPSTRTRRRSAGSRRPLPHGPRAPPPGAQAVPRSGRRTGPRPTTPLLLGVRLYAGTFLVNLGDYGAATTELTDFH
ncbi:serine/threonine protein kinase [Streptomyces sp. NPDC053079]|uniref:serine/threonine protein kinase n=1 Tax=Streptomyces sp. NPDC053079 TaxID=3365697 RepID=UPI0037D2E869